MVIEIKVPSPGESVTEVQIARWLKADGDFVEKEEVLCEIDSDKATLTLNAEESGQLKILVPVGETLKVKSVVCTIDTDVKQAVGSSSKQKVDERQEIKNSNELVTAETSNIKPRENRDFVNTQHQTSNTKDLPSVAAKKIMEEKNISASQIIATGKGERITKADVLQALSAGFSAENSEVNKPKGTREVERKKVSALRKKLSQRLVSVKNETAMLTTFNEVDMSEIFAIRNKYKDAFKEKYGVNLGFMSFFTKAVTEALFHFPVVNAMLDGDEIVYHQYTDIGIAVSAPKGLVVPVLRNAESMSLAQIENEIKNLAVKARENRITLEEMTGGTFTITNGGVFGSMLSTPILNPPQSAILGMHNIVDRAVAVNGQVVIRPIMYVALSYDHRLIDGKDSVGFLVKVKELLEHPAKMLFDGKETAEVLLGL